MEIILHIVRYGDDYIPDWSTELNVHGTFDGIIGCSYNFGEQSTAGVSFDVVDVQKGVILRIWSFSLVWIRKDPLTCLTTFHLRDRCYSAVLVGESGGA